MLAPFERIRRVEVIAAAAALLLALLLGAVLSTQLTAPIRTLVGATERVGRGDYDFQRGSAAPATNSARLPARSTR